MFKILFVPLSLLLFQNLALAQTGKSHLLSTNVEVPVGVFAGSHFAGAVLSYSWSQKRFGDKILKKSPGFLFNSGAGYYFGKNSSPVGYNFRYGGYFYFYALPGLITNPWQKWSISLNAGPGIGIYKGKTEVGLNALMAGSYFLNQKIAIGPGISFKKHSQTYALWSGIIRISVIL